MCSLAIGLRPRSSLFPYTTLFRSSWFYEVLEAGYKYNLTDFQSAIGLVQLAKCDAMKQARERIAQLYSDAFRSEEHTSDSSHMSISYAVCCLKKTNGTARCPAHDD